MYTCLPYTSGTLNEVPEDEDECCGRLKENRLPDYTDADDRFHDELIEEYGEEHGSNVQHMETFEICEYGAPVMENNYDALFPIF